VHSYADNWPKKKKRKILHVQAKGHPEIFTN
jgi:hypothetical protein